MRIVFAGTPEFAVPSLHALAAAGHEIVGVITRADAPRGRKRILTPSPVADAAEAAGIPVHKANRLDEATTAWVRELAPDLGVIVAYGGLVRDPLLTLPTHGWINLHFSALPRWRGAAPVQRALAAGEQELGLTVFRLIAALDAGNVLTRDSHAFPEGTTAGTALTALAEAGTRPLTRAVDALAADPEVGTPQTGDATYAEKLTRADGELDLSADTSTVLAAWAGVTPEPGAYVHGDAQPLKLHDVSRADDARDPALAAGTVTLVGGQAILHLHDGALALARVQPAGKPAMDGAAWLRGRGGKADLA